MTNALKDLSNALGALVEESQKSLLAIRSGRLPATGVVWTDGEHAVTVAHIMGRASEGEVILPSGETRTARLVGRDPGTDLAVIRVEGGGLPPARWDDSVPLKVGQLGVVVGRGPSGARATLGMVTTVGDRWRTPLGGEVDRYLDVDAVLPRGASGGVLLDVEGRVQGVNTHGLIRGGATLPTATVRRSVERILERGDVKRGWLGVGVHRGHLSKEAADDVGQRSALLATSVAEDSPAAKAGVVVGDALLELAGFKLTRFEDLQAALGSLGGVTTTLTLLRGGQVLQLEVTAVVRERGRRC